MATVLEALKRKALRGVIREIEPVDGFMTLISAEIDERETSIASELPVEEVERLNLKVGDAVDIFPIDIDTYLIIDRPKN